MKTKGEKKQVSGTVWLMVSIILFLFLVGYLGLNLSGVNYGYELQELAAYEKTLLEDIHRLEAKRASLLNLERVEKTVIEKLGYQYPEPDQIIKAFEDEDEEK